MKDPALPRNKYNFHLLEIGGEMFVPGKPAQIRTAATMWGTRYGFWLTTRKASPADNYGPTGLWVKRVEDPPRQKKRKREDKTDHQLLKELHDAVRCLTVLICQVKADVAKLANDS